MTVFPNRLSFKVYPLESPPPPPPSRTPIVPPQGTSSCYETVPIVLHPACYPCCYLRGVSAFQLQLTPLFYSYVTHILKYIEGQICCAKLSCVGQ